MALSKEGFLILAIIAIAAAVLVPSEDAASEKAVLVDQSDFPRLVHGGPAISPGREPAQAEILAFDVDLGRGFTATATHRYTIAGRVLLNRPYNWDRTAAISPLDLAIGWGDMAAPDVLDAFELGGGRRLVHIAARDPSRDVRAMMEFWSNTHVIPASDTLRDDLLEIEPNQMVRLHGYLVQVRGPRGLTWDSSTIRTDYGFIGCEVMLVTAMETIAPDAPMQTAGLSPAHVPSATSQPSQP